MAEMHLTDDCRAADKKRPLIVSYSDKGAFVCCLLHRCGVVKLQENAWQTVSLTIFREKKKSEHAIYRSHTNRQSSYQPKITLVVIYQSNLDFMENG